MDFTLLATTFSAGIISNCVIYLRHGHFIDEKLVELWCKWKKQELTEEARFEVAESVVCAQSECSHEIMISSTLATISLFGLYSRLVKRAASSPLLAGRVMSYYFFFKSTKALFRYIKLHLDHKKKVLKLVSDIDIILFSPDRNLFRKGITTEDLQRLSRDYKSCRSPPRDHDPVLNIDLQNRGPILSSPRSDQVSSSTSESGVIVSDNMSRSAEYRFRVDSLDTALATAERGTKLNPRLTNASLTIDIEATIYLSCNVDRNDASSVESFLKQGKPFRQLYPSKDNRLVKLLFYQRRGLYHYHLAFGSTE